MIFTYENLQELAQLRNWSLASYGLHESSLTIRYSLKSILSEYKYASDAQSHEGDVLIVQFPEYSNYYNKHMKKYIKCVYLCQRILLTHQC